MFAEAERSKVGHKTHPGVAGYHHYIALFEQSETQYYVRFTVHQMPGWAKKAEGHSRRCVCALFLCVGSR